ncbi:MULTISPECIES: M20 aminoacylase family protein [unclassified Undibacterium]|uniref:M20 aminoacylase family protein n=1 Tax=unclassified Undibacterium TaxID=2630295 RepID=UPI002AC993D2|nr:MULTISPECIES: M20 aminoacylase family protein [unclassified Undibacterium]MEB0141171.1 M20 aminoacylase family protein [Undibacterium sp. CCC2.1]MEB0174204.1 M20 aminoacylase family protein [Undibacterium sp. CCC1.1]MEB0178148.1 M20 aminoacylase family protein [Undibacterium sp. CCC3.4]MEB0217353.1 M20 aminoacylase family protein [Undibacterium sp. 5I2]WPX44698.1 M20 aminoacylase family protein [Undibacterium sp. CCC3.4]
MNLLQPILQAQTAIQQIRRDLHAHPELCYQEFRTADVVARQLEAWGIEVVRGLGGTGVLGIIRNGSSTRALGLRADMDALPMQEINTFDHASQHAGKMHACGHDGHTAMLLGAAHYLSEHQDFDGTVYLIFQPAEEGGGGARAMINDGLFETYPMQAVFGMHNWPGAAVGSFGVTPGPMMASSNEFEVVVHGKGAHAAQPHKGIDPIIAAIQIAQSWQTIVSRNASPLASAVLSVTQIHAGSATNVIPDDATLIGTVRAFSTEMVDLVENRMRAIAEHTAAAFDATVSFEFKRNYPPLINHAAETAFATEVMRAVVGVEHVDAAVEPTMGAEDFAFMLQAKAGCYVFLGNGDGDHRSSGHGLGPCNLHNPSYDFNDELLPIGATYWVKLAEAYLKKSNTAAI